MQEIPPGGISKPFKMVIDELIFVADAYGRMCFQMPPECYTDKNFDPSGGRQGKTSGEKEKPYATDFASRMRDYLKEREIS